MNLLLMLFAVVLASAAGYVLGRRGAEAHSRVEEPGAPAEIEEPGARAEEEPGAPAEIEEPDARAEEPLVEGLRAAPDGVTERTLTSEHTALANPTSAESLGDSITPVEPVVPEPVLASRQNTYPTPVAIKRVTKWPNANGETAVQVHYRNLAQASTSRFLNLMRDEGLELESFGATELHDRYEDFETYSCSSYDELLATRPWERVYGAWKMSGTYQGSELLISACHPSGLDEGIIVRFAEADDQLVQPLLAAFERAFTPDVFLMNGHTVERYTGTRDCVELPSGYPDECHVIGERAFSDNKHLVSVLIPPCVKAIGAEAFKGCTNLAEVRLVQGEETSFNKAKEQLVTTPVENPVDIGRAAFEGCTALKSLFLHPGVRSLGARCFFGCCSLERLWVYDTLTQVGAQAFWGCDSLTSAGPSGTDAPYSIQLAYRTALPGYKTDRTEIPGNLFAYLRGLKRVVIPEGVTRLDKDALWCCDALEELVLPSTLESLADNAIGRCPTLRHMQIPAGTHVEGALLRGCDALADRDGFIIVDSVLYDYVGHAVHVKIPTGVTRIAAQAFAYGAQPGVNHGDIVSVEIPEGVVSIGAGAFRGCERLERAELPDTVTSVAENAFAGCRALKGGLAEEGHAPSSGQPGHSCPATYVVGSDRCEGMLVVGPRGFSFTAKGEGQGQPIVSGVFEGRHEPLVRSGSRLIVTTRGKQCCFELAAIDLDEIEGAVRKRKDELQCLRSFTGSIADSCVSGSWDGVTHPFFKRHACAKTDRAAVFKLIGWEFLTQPIPWESYDVSVERSQGSLRIVARRGGTEYCYSETPTGLSVTYESESWGFFDDSEHHESGSCRLEHLEHPSAEQLGRAIDVGEAKGSEDVCYLRNPFGLDGIFRLERR